MKNSTVNLNVLPAHTLHKSCDPREFPLEFQHQTGISVSQVTDDVIVPEAPRAVFLVGSIPLGMATDTSDVDLIALVDSRDSLVAAAQSNHTNSDTRLYFSRPRDSLVVVEVVTLTNGVAVDVQVVVTAAIEAIYSRLRQGSVFLSENEVKTLSRLATGWCVWQSDGYLDRHTIDFSGPELDSYCCAKKFASAVDFLQDAFSSRDLPDLPLALRLGASSVEAAYLAYFASEGYSYLGPKWLAQIGHAAGAADRVHRHPVLEQSLPLLFPSLESTCSEVTAHLQAVSEFLVTVQELIGHKARKGCE